MSGKRKIGQPNQRKSRRKRGDSARAAAVDFWWEADVRLTSSRSTHNREDRLEERLMRRWNRADDKTAKEYNLEGGATLHLVLALRGGC